MEGMEKWQFLGYILNERPSCHCDWQYHRKATRRLWFQWKHLSPLNQQTSQRHLESDQKSAASSQTAGNQREENSAKDPAGRQSAKLRMWGILQKKQKQKLNLQQKNPAKLELMHEILHTKTFQWIRKCDPYFLFQFQFKLYKLKRKIWRRKKEVMKTNPNQNNDAIPKSC